MLTRTWYASRESSPSNLYLARTSHICSGSYHKGRPPRPSIQAGCLVMASPMAKELGQCLVCLDESVAESCWKRLAVQGYRGRLTTPTTLAGISPAKRVSASSISWTCGLEFYAGCPVAKTEAKIGLEPSWPPYCDVVSARSN
jgi:hypothetical protein